jgi:cell wall-associated NlpC family hydrolase
MIAALLLGALATGCATQNTALRREPPVRLGRLPPAEVSDPGAPVPPRAREVVLHALSQVGAPYQSAGRSPATGFDCSGLVQYVMSQGAGISLPRDTSNMSQTGLEVGTAEQLRPGDLVFFNTLGRPYSHVGIYVGGQRFIHAPTQGGFVGVVDMRLPYWQQRFDGARRLDL